MNNYNNKKLKFSQRWFRRFLPAGIKCHVFRWKSTNVSGETYCLHLQGWRVSQGRKGKLCLLGLHFNPDDRGDTYLQNVGWLSTDCMALYPSRQSFSMTKRFKHWAGRSIFKLTKDTVPLERYWGRGRWVFKDSESYGYVLFEGTKQTIFIITQHTS
jgi:hypothetical protein